MIKKLSLSTALAVATVAMGAFTQAAEAALFNFSYTLENGDVFSGMLEGEVQGDNDTVFVSALTMPMFNGSPHPDIPFLVSLTTRFGGSSAPPTVSFSGTLMDFCANDEPNCNGDEGILFDTVVQFLGGPIVVTGLAAGFVSEPYNPANWSLTPKSVPEPLTILGAGAAIGFGTAFKRKLAQKEVKQG